MQPVLRRLVVISQLAAVLLASGISACSTSPFDEDGKAVVTATVSRTSFHTGDSVLVSVTTTNVGRGMLSIGFNFCSRMFSLLKDQQGSLVPMGCGGTQSAVGHSPIFVRPNESYTVNHVFRGQFEPWAVELTPGNYAIQGSVMVLGEPNGGPVQSEPVAFQILTK